MRFKQAMVWFLLLCTMLVSGCSAVDHTQTQPQTQETTQMKDWQSILSYSEYLKMTKDEQDAFYNSFEDANEFFMWYSTVKAIYDKEREENHYDGGSINVGG